MDTSPNKLKEARDLFHHLLMKKTTESEWQKFFAKHPYAITPSLPLRLEPHDIIPLGRSGKTEPDFIFYPRNTTPIQFYGVIELKRPDQKIVTQTRKNVAILSRDAQTAVEQTLQYASTVPDLIRTPIAGGQLFLGNDQYLFVIMGLIEHEFVLRPGNESYREIIQNRLPDNLTILPYDILLKNFEEQSFKSISVLTPHGLVTQKTTEDEVKMDVVLSVFEERSEAIISHRLLGMPTYGNAPFPRASDGQVVDRLFEEKEEALKYVMRVFPNLKIIDKTTEQ